MTDDSDGMPDDSDGTTDDSDGMTDGGRHPQERLRQLRQIVSRFAVAERDVPVT